ncbi:hypothetical protein Q7A_03190 [Methylophaga nitratireducenticrescens]|nr:hypothetical protein Q7A_03190 [Methylophaga nitratireducenticrescens]AUZ83353.1 hypothetical protein CDW43_01620 [Methylophaga nitratireducenticrescens]
MGVSIISASVRHGVIPQALENRIEDSLSTERTNSSAVIVHVISTAFTTFLYKLSTILVKLKGKDATSLPHALTDKFKEISVDLKKSLT